MDVERLSAGLLDLGNVFSRELVGLVDRVGAPVGPEDAGLEDGDGEGVIEGVMSFQNSEDLRAIISSRMDGIRSMKYMK